MNERHPFVWITSHHRGQTFVLWSVGAILLTILMQIVGAPLITEAAPQGIVSFELAGTTEAARAMLDSWDGTARVYAGLSLGLDYLFMVAYAGAIGVGCVLVAQRLGGMAAAGGIVLSWGMVLAAALDVIENVALIRVLFGAGGSWPLVARWCAIPKFVLVGLGLLYVITGAVVVAVGRRR